MVYLIDYLLLLDLSLWATPKSSSLFTSHLKYKNQKKIHSAMIILNGKISFINRNMTPSAKWPKQKQTWPGPGQAQTPSSIGNPSDWPIVVSVCMIATRSLASCNISGKYLPLSPIILDYKTGIIWGRGWGELFFNWLGGGNTIFCQEILFVSTLKSKNK